MPYKEVKTKYLCKVAICPKCRQPGGLFLCLAKVDNKYKVIAFNVLHKIPFPLTKENDYLKWRELKDRGLNSPEIRKRYTHYEWSTCYLGLKTFLEQHNIS